MNESLYEVNLETGSRRKLAEIDEPISWFFVVGDWVYFTEFLPGAQIGDRMYRVNIDGTDFERLH